MAFSVTLAEHESITGEPPMKTCQSVYRGMENEYVLVWKDYRAKIIGE